MGNSKSIRIFESLDYDVNQHPNTQDTELLVGRTSRN